MRRFLPLFGLLAVIFASSPAWASCTLSGGALTFKDGAGTSQTIANQTDGTNCWPQLAQTGSVPTTVTLQSAATASGNGTNLVTTGMATATLTVNCASCSGGTTVNFEGSEDGTNYSSLNAIQLGSSTIAQSTTTAGLTYWEMSVVNLQNIRARISGYSSGTVTVTGHTTPMPGSPRTVQLAPGGNTIGKIDVLGNAGGVLDAPTGSAPPANALYTGTLQSGATGGHVGPIIQCDNHVFKHITTATDTLAVQGVASQTIYVCAWRSRAAGVATWFLENTASANANCSSANTQITGVATEAANTGETWGGALWSGLKNTSGNGLCINSTGTGGVDVDVWYAQF